MLASSIRMEKRLAIPFLFSQTLKSPYDPLVLVLVVPEWHLPVIVPPPSWMFLMNSLTKKVWYDAQLSR